MLLISDLREDALTLLARNDFVGASWRENSLGEKETDDATTTINVLFGFRFYALLSIFVDLSREILLCPTP